MCHSTARALPDAETGKLTFSEVASGCSVLIRCTKRWGGVSCLEGEYNPRGKQNVSGLFRFLQDGLFIRYISPADIRNINPLNPELNPICYLLALLGAHHFLHVSRIRIKLLTFRLLMSYIYGAPILDVSRSHTTTQHSR